MIDIETIQLKCALAKIIAKSDWLSEELEKVFENLRHFIICLILRNEHTVNSFSRQSR